MAYVGTGHEKAGRTDARHCTLAGSAVDGDVFPKDRPFANLDPAYDLSRELEVLRIATDHRTVSDFAIFCQSHTAQNLGVTRNPAPFTDLNPTLDDRIRADLHTGSDSGIWIYDGCRMNFHWVYLATTNLQTKQGDFPEWRGIQDSFGRIKKLSGSLNLRLN